MKLSMLEINNLRYAGKIPFAIEMTLTDKNECRSLGIVSGGHYGDSCFGLLIRLKKEGEPKVIFHEVCEHCGHEIE
jgi:hypothetical protein